MKKVVEKQTKDEKVNVYDDVEMVSLGIRKPVLTPRDPSVWTKTLSEKAAVRVHRNKKYNFVTKWGYRQKSIPVYSKLIVTIKPSARFTMVNKKGERVNKTTYSFNCGQSDIPRILSKFVEIDKASKITYPLVKSYYWNGKTYKPSQLPFWK